MELEEWGGKGQQSHHEQADLQPALWKGREKISLCSPNYLEPTLNLMTCEHTHEMQIASHSVHY